MDKQQNVDLNEIKKFEEMASRWWDLEGEFKPLHQINPLRLDYVLEKPMVYLVKPYLTSGAAVASLQRVWPNKVLTSPG